MIVVQTERRDFRLHCVRLDAKNIVASLPSRSPQQIEAEIKGLNGSFDQVGQETLKACSTASARFFSHRERILGESMPGLMGSTISPGLAAFVAHYAGLDAKQLKTQFNQRLAGRHGAPEDLTKGELIKKWEALMARTQATFYEKAANVLEEIVAVGKSLVETAPATYKDLTPVLEQLEEKRKQFDSIQRASLKTLHEQRERKSFRRKPRGHAPA